jgi:predicted MFS family arabinose efflux permease
MAIAPFFEWMVGVRAVLAVCAGTFTGTALATAAMLAPAGKRGQSMQIVTTGRSLASLVGVPLGAVIATQIDWRVNYWVLAALGVAAALALYFKLPRGMHGDTQTMRERVRVLRNPGVVPALITSVLFLLGALAVSIYIAAIMEGAGIGIDLLPLVLLASGVGALVSSLSAGRIADRIGNRTMAIGASLVTVGTLTVLAVLPLMPEALRMPVLLATVVVGGYVGPAYGIVVGSELAHLAPSSVPVAISLNMSAFSIAAAVAAAGGGVIVDAWGASALAVAGVPPVLGALAIWLTTGRRAGSPLPPGVDQEPIDPPGGEAL